MKTKLLITVVEDVFQIDGRGTVITGFQQPHTGRIRKGLAIVFETPLDTVITTSIAELEMFRGRVPDDRPQVVGILLADCISSEQIPRGTKVYDASDTNAA